MILARPTPDWTAHLSRDERLLWTGRPEFLGMILLAAFILLLGVAIAPRLLLGILIPIGLFAYHAGDAYALTSQRILALRQPLGGKPRLESLPRAGTFAGPQMSGGPQAVVFTAPDGRKVSFRFVSRSVQRLLIDRYPSGGPINMGEAAQ